MLGILTISIERCTERRSHGNPRDDLESSNALPDTQVILLGPHDGTHAFHRHIVSLSGSRILDNFGARLRGFHRGDAADGKV
jgi:hypothetical protein